MDAAKETVMEFAGQVPEVAAKTRFNDPSHPVYNLLLRTFLSPGFQSGHTLVINEEYDAPSILGYFPVSANSLILCSI